jgi:U3 small nucleolar RNA-associated protein 21
MATSLTRFPPELEALASLSLADTTSVFSTPAQLDSELITLTLLPRARWQTLLNLDVIAVRHLPFPLSPYQLL